MSRRSTVLESPQTTIGARELLQVGDISKSGFVRKQGLLERWLKFLRWRQRFMVLSRGCLYVFKNEFSGSPQMAIYLGVYNKCSRLYVDQVQWAFQIIPADRGTNKVVILCCTTNSVRVDWMKAVKDEMVKAHKLTEAQITEHQKGLDMKDEYAYPEKPLTGSSTSRAARNRYSQHPPPNVASAQVSKTPVEGDEYWTIDESAMHSAGTVGKLVPAIMTDPPVGKKGKVSKNAKAKPVVAKKPQKPKMPSPAPSPKVTNKLGYGTKENGKPLEILKLNEGGYLVRQSRSDDKKVLSVKIDRTMKEFKIHERDKQLTLDHTTYFNSVEELLDFYTSNNIPKKQIPLGKPYKYTSPTTPGYINVQL